MLGGQREKKSQDLSLQMSEAICVCVWVCSGCWVSVTRSGLAAGLPCYHCLMKQCSHDITGSFYFRLKLWLVLSKNMMHPNKIHFCAINKRSVMKFRLLSDKNPILLFPQVLAMSFKHHLQMSSLSVFACCALDKQQRFLWESNILYRVIELNDCMLLLLLLQKRCIWFPSPGLTARHRSVCHTGSVTFVPVFLAFYLLYICLSKYYFVSFIAVTCCSAQNSKCQKRVTNSTSIFFGLFIWWLLCIAIWKGK